MKIIWVVAFVNFFHFTECLQIIFDSQCDFSGSLPLKICDFNSTFFNTFQSQNLEVQLDSDLFIAETMNFENLQIILR